jgi:transcriptional regulator with XRE-family HTH domain
VPAAKKPNLKASKIFGRNVKATREQADLTQEALAHACHVHPVEVSRIERGVRDLRLSTVERYADGLGVPASDLLVGVGRASR